MVETRRTAPLRRDIPIVEPDSGRPTLQFIRQWLEQRQINVTIDGVTIDLNELQGEVAELLARQIATEADSGLQGGGDLSEDRSLSLTDTGVAPDTYGNATNVGQFTVDAQGRITAAENVPISGGGGGSSPWELVDDITVPNPTTFLNVTDLGIYDEIQVWGIDVPSSSNGQRVIQFSEDNGVSWESGGTYLSYASDGSTQTNSSAGVLFTHTGVTTAARGFWEHIFLVAGRTTLDQRGRIHTADNASPINAIRFFNANASGVQTGNLTGGRITIWGRRL